MIFYLVSLPGGETELRHIKPDATADTLFATLPPEISAAAPNPSVANQVVFAYQPTAGGNYGIYRNSSISPNGAVQLVPPIYGYVFSMQVTPNGQSIIYSANAPDADPDVFRLPINGGTPVVIDQSAWFPSISPDGSKIVYGKTAVGDLQSDLFVANVIGGGITRLTENPEDETMPFWSRDGTRIVYSRIPPGTEVPSYDLYVMNSNGTNQVAVLATADMSETGASFSPDGTRIAYVAFSLASDDESGLYTAATSGGAATRVQLRSGGDVTGGTYWTSASGRQAVREYLMRLDRRRNRR